MGEFSFGWPQGIYLALAFMGLGITAAKHGNPKEGKHDFWSIGLATLLSLSLLWWGGFFAGQAG